MDTRERLSEIERMEERNRQHEKEWRERQNITTITELPESERVTISTNVPERVRQLEAMCRKYPMYYQIMEEENGSITICAPATAIWGTFTAYA